NRSVTERFRAAFSGKSAKCLADLAGRLRTSHDGTVKMLATAVATTLIDDDISDSVPYSSAGRWTESNSSDGNCWSRKSNLPTPLPGCKKGTGYSGNKPVFTVSPLAQMAVKGKKQMKQNMIATTGDLEKERRMISYWTS
ncbi:MAG: hypothetical protein ACR2PT_15455, partial [Endozoicomonas sp.]